MSGECNKQRYEYCPAQEGVIKQVLQSISEFERAEPFLPPTRCQIEEALPQLLHGAIAHALCDLVERGKVEPRSDYFQGQGWLMVWKTR